MLVNGLENKEFTSNVLRDVCEADYFMRCPYKAPEEKKWADSFLAYVGDYFGVDPINVLSENGWERKKV